MARWLWHDIGWHVGVHNDLVMRICYLVWALWDLAHFDSFWACLGFCSWEAIFWKFAIFVDSFVKCLYIFTIMTAMTFLNCATSCLIIILLVAFLCALCLFEKPRVAFFAFSAWFMHCQQGGEVWTWKSLLHTFRECSCSLGCILESWNFSLITGPTGVGTGLTGVVDHQSGHRSDQCGVPIWPVWAVMLFVVCILSWGEALGDFEHWFRGSLHEYACVLGEFLWFVALVVLLFVHRWRGALLPPLWGVGTSFALKWSCFCLVFGFWSLVELVSFSLLLFLSFHIVTVCVVNALIKGEIEDQERPRARVVAS